MASAEDEGIARHTDAGPTDREDRQPLGQSPEGSPCTSFTCFPQLPNEVRIIIWKFCIPRRIIDIAWLGSVNNYVGIFRREQISMAYRSLRAPVITRVCSESRKVVVQEGGHMHIINRGGSHYIWINPKYDMFQEIQRWTGNYPYTSLYRTERTRQLHSTEPISWLACEKDDTGTHQLDIDALMPPDQQPGMREQIFVRILIEFVHGPYAQATKTGLFGLTGEEHSIFVDLGDTAKLQRLVQLETQGMPSDEYQEHWDAKLHMWAASAHIALDKAKGGYLWSRVLRYLEDNNLTRAESGVFKTLSGSERMKIRNSTMYWQLLDTEHPLIQVLREQGPQLRPVIMWRLCDATACPARRTLTFTY
ncbi:uncharacterized protein E0L32_012132 [Thyridium curvatum]|uniref:2EXR domain-containing protein n=1 Tax=Thyridium curvatum TaxID=1093900 RepID=A0A507BJF2_9PEZI|nr:uncharacterized protein E0L32_012132 [Thyridium curvatum]TPX17569.1 hypothetical protein E0L32_012132 [Thyridium curvatum]